MVTGDFVVNNYENDKKQANDTIFMWDKSRSETFHEMCDSDSPEAIELRSRIEAILSQ